MLSGFCIHLSFRRQTEFKAGRFFAQRFWRIYPAYLAALVFFAVLGTLRTGAPPSPVQVATHLALVHNFSGATCFGINGSFWSLAVEMQLYALYPLVLTLRKRWGMPRCLAAALIIGMGWRLFAWKVGGLGNPPITSILTAPPMTWFDWCLGAYAADRYADGEPEFPASLIVGLSSAALLVFSTLYKPATIFSFSLAAVLSAVVLDIVVRKDLSESVWVRSLTWLGVVSYSVYLWHEPILHLGEATLRPWFSQVLPPLLRVGASVAFTWCIILFIGWTSYHFLEQGGLRLRRWIEDLG